MPDETAVLEAPVDAGLQDNSAGESSESITQRETPDKPAQDEKIDGRKQPDALKKYISDLRKQAETELDPAVKAQKLAHAKDLFDKVGKNSAYESVFPTVREVKEVKALLETMGAEHNGDWRTGLQTMQQRIVEARQIDQQLETGDPAVVQKLWDEAPEGVPKLMPALLEKFAESKPAEYEKAVTPHALNIMEKAGFVGSLNAIYAALKEGDSPTILKVVNGMKGWFDGNKQTAQDKPKTDPEVERLRTQLKDRETKDMTAANEKALTEVETHSLPLLETKLKAIVGKLGLTPDQMKVLTRHAWDDLIATRNANGTYKTVATSKYQQGAPAWVTYAKEWTNDNATEAARKVANLYYGHQLRNGAAKTAPDPTRAVIPGVSMGEQPTREEIDYGPRGKMAARKAGYKDLGDMLMAHRAPLLAGGIRQWK